ncbi:protein FAM200A-like [Macrobrachium nipponense]|uniref:protein FAM200A-like n=1 Tax=Macrobrachium nipponense TaxID=159736 RepID=UPI0030C8577F
MAVEPENKVFRNMALSNNTIQRRMDELGMYISREVSISLSKSPFFSLCLDESNDITKTNQMLICVRCYDVDQKDFAEKFLCLTSIKERASAVNIHKAIKDSLNKLNVSLNNLCAATADGAAVMKSKRNVLSLINKDCEGEIVLLHCIVHQEVLVSKTIIKHFDDVELLVRKVINVINTISVLSNSFESLCEINDEKHNVLLNYNHVRWLSFDHSVTRLCELYDEVLHALTEKHNDIVEILRNDNVRCSIPFLKDFLPRLSSINKQLQNRRLTVVDAMFLTDQLKNTAKGLASQVIDNDLSNFPSLESYLREISDDTVETNIQTKIR